MALPCEATFEPDPVLEECPLCEEMEVLSDDEEQGFIFTEALCARCRETVIEDGKLDAFDIQYLRATANGWAD